VVQFVREGGDGAVDCFGDAVAEREREEGLVAGWEGDVLQLAEAVGYLEEMLDRQNELGSK
jgi:hypothetical protein